MKAVYILAWLFGIGGILANFLIYQQKNRKSLLAVKLFSDCLWAAHYGALSAWSGAAICLIGIARESVFLNQNCRWAKSKLWLLLFLVCSVISAVFTWKNVFSILPACASVLSVFSFWIGNPRITRYLQLPVSIAFLIYNVVYSSYAGIINEAMTLISLVIAFCRVGVQAKNTQ